MNCPHCGKDMPHLVFAADMTAIGVADLNGNGLEPMNWGEVLPGTLWYGCPHCNGEIKVGPNQ